MSRSTSTDKRQRAYHHGVWAEVWCEAMLRIKGYRLLERRMRNAVGEIDLIVRKGSQLVFVEVKARRETDDGLYAVTPTQQQRIVRAASLWLAENPRYEGFDCRFDVMAVATKGKVDHIQNAFY